MKDTNVIDPKAGDQLVRVCSRHSSESKSLVKVERTTRTQIVIGHERFYKKNSHLVGSSESLAFTYVRFPNPGEVDEIKAKQKADARKAREAAEARRQDLVGRPLGYITAACEALEEQMRDARKAGIDTDSHVFQAIAAAQVLARRVAEDLRRAEESCAENAAVFRSMADQLERSSQGRTRYRESFFHQRMFEAQSSEDQRHLLSEQVTKLVELAAHLLGVDPAELIRPYAPKEST